MVRALTTLWGPTVRGTRLVLREGVPVRIVGSHHPWLGDRGPRCALLPAVDDATGVVAASRAFGSILVDATTFVE